MRDFGDTWREQSDSAIWDKMWALHVDSSMTQVLTDIAFAIEAREEERGARARIFEIGCGWGHWISSLRKAGFKGAYGGCDIGPGPVKSSMLRAEGDGVHRGDFLNLAYSLARAGVPPFDAVFTRGVVQHQAHWMPLIMAAMRIAPVVYCGIGYVTDLGHHQPSWRDGHCDVQISPEMLAQEAGAVGLYVAINRYRNPARKCDELLVKFTMQPDGTV